MDPGDTRNLDKIILFFNAVIVCLCAAISYFLHPVLAACLPVLKAAVPLRQQLILFLLWLPAWIAVVLALRFHRVFTKAPAAPQLLFETFKLYGTAFVALTFISYITQLDLNRTLAVLFFGISFSVTFLANLAIITRSAQQYYKGVGRSNLLLIGNESTEMREFVDRILSLKYPPGIYGRMTDDNHTGDPEPPQELNEKDISTDIQNALAVVGRISQFNDYLHSNPVDEVVFFEPYNNPAKCEALLHTCEELGIPAWFHVKVTHNAQSLPRVMIRQKTPFVLFEISPRRTDLLALKHAFDYIAALILILLLSPIMFIAAVGILITMGRPVLFWQKRAGRFGREFNMIKFRTMKNGAEERRDELLGKNEMDGPVFKIAKDPRITGFGALLRRFSIDELPQLFNVLNGTMSLVGPRPLPVQEQQEIKGWKRRRLSMKPGITCIWQVSGRNEISFEKWMKMDLEYIDHWSLWLDMAQLFRTIGAVLTTRGAK
jgi:exopolysaccharide biosynthesis polyprenyl glycosylphosphotransferase